MQFTVPLWKQQKFIYRCPPVLQNHFISYIYHSPYIILAIDSIFKHNIKKKQKQALLVLLSHPSLA